MRNKNTINWLKALLFVSLIFAANYAMATDSTSITELTQSAKDVESGGNVVAGVGGFVVIVIAGLWRFMQEQEFYANTAMHPSRDYPMEY